jgi:hypothetical protein
MDDHGVLAVNERIAGRMLGVSTAALRRWRRENRGPQFVRLGRCVRYVLRDLGDFLEKNTHAISAGKNNRVPIETREHSK